MTTLTPEQRLEAYEWTFRKIRIEGGCIGICCLLDDYLIENHTEASQYVKQTTFQPWTERLFEIFPEFARHKPVDAVVWYQNWFPFSPEGNNKRKEICLDCIEEVTQLINHKKAGV